MVQIDVNRRERERLLGKAQIPFPEQNRNKVYGGALGTFAQLNQGLLEATKRYLDEKQKALHYEL